MNFSDSMHNISPDSSVDGMGEMVSSQKNIMFEPAGKDDEEEELSSRIKRIYYLNAYASEVYPSPNPDFLSSLNSNDILVYSCGSLWTSIMPVLAIRGVAAAIARSRSLKAKVLLRERRLSLSLAHLLTKIAFSEL